MLADILDSLPKNGASQLCELGKIKIGAKSQQERTAASGAKWRAPEKHDHFTITTLNRDARGDLVPDTKLMADLLEKYGDPDRKLRQIPIRLLSDDIDDIIQSAFVWYGAKSVGARSDGRRLTWFYNPETMQRYQPPFEEDWTSGRLEMQFRGKPLFKVHTVLNCVIAAEEARWGGVYKFRTTSIVSMKQLAASLLHIQALTNGILVGMPLRLVMRPIQVSPEGKATTVYVVHVELRGGELMQIQKQAMDQAKYKLEFRRQVEAYQSQYRKLLVAPGHESAEDAAEVVGEFVPEAVDVPESPASGYSILDDDIPGGSGGSRPLTTGAAAPEAQSTPAPKPAAETPRAGEQEPTPKAAPPLAADGSPAA